MVEKTTDKLLELEESAKDDELESPFSAFIRYEKGARSPESVADSNRETHGEYLFGKDYEDTSDDKIKKTNWTSYTGSRMMVRLFSRGILGASFYAMGQAATRNQMKNYRPDLPLGSFFEYPLHYIARGYDNFAAPVIKTFIRHMPLGKTAEEMQFIAEDMVIFRDKFFGAMPVTPYNTRGTGRSLGHEVVAMTFDFACGSVGDALGRQITNALDPNITNSWYKDGHFDANQFGKSFLQQGWKIFAKNQGEDWAAALPYVYQVRWQRQMLNNHAAGFKFLADRVRGGWRVNKQGQIIGSYAGPLAVDLQLRFTGYNWYTLMYRDFYDRVADVIDDYRTDGAVPKLHIPDNPLQATLDSAAYSFRYILKSAIKTGIYMTPSVPFFWMFRVPQGKYKGVAQYISAPGEDRQQTGYVHGPDGAIYNYFDHHEQILNGGVVSLKGRPLPNSSFNKEFFPHGPQASIGMFDKMFDGYGKLCYNAGDAAYKTVRRMGMNYSWLGRDHVHDLVNASMSYTPYMIAKAETALRWDKPTMDRAIYRLIDGAAALKIGEVKGALHDIREQIIHPPTPRKVAIAVQEARDKQAKEQAERELLKAQIKAELQAGEMPAPTNQVNQIRLMETSLPEKTVDTTEKPSGESWKHRTLERFSKETEVPPGASIH